MSPPVIWQNWAGNLTAFPADIQTPQTLEALVEVIVAARSQGRRVRVVGSGHSWSPLVPTDGVLIRTSGFATLCLDDSRTVLSVGPAVTVDQLAQFLIDNEVCVPSSVGIGLGEATMGGVFSTGCHGSGIATPSVSDWIVGVDLVDSDGVARTFSLDADGAEVMNALRLSLGMLGVVTLYRIAVQPMFNVHVVEWKAPVTDTMAGLRDLVMGNDYAEVSWMPFNDGIWVQKANRTDRPVTRNGFNPPPNAFRDKLYAVGSALALDALENNPSMTPDILRTSFHMLDSRDYVSSITHYVHCADYGFFLQSYRLIDIEAVFEVDENFDAVRLAFDIGVQKVAEWAARGHYPLNVTLGFRFIKNSEALLSSCHGNTITCMVEVFSYHNTPLFEEFSKELLTAWLDALPRARTHWAKAFQYLPDPPGQLRKAFGAQLDRFLDVRKEMGVDPDNLFLNDTLEALFYD